MNNTITNAYQLFDQTQDAMFQSLLATYTIVDIGMIQQIEDRRAVVATNRFIGGKQVIYQDVEVLYIGGGGSFIDASSGAYICLLFAPAQNIYDTDDPKVPIRSQPYADTCLKAIPLTSGTEAITSLAFSETGSIVIGSTDTSLYRVEFADHYVTISTAYNSYTWDADGTVQTWLGAGLYNKVAKADGNQYTLIFNTDGTVSMAQFIKPDGTITRYRMAFAAMEAAEQDDPSTFTNYMWIEEWSPDGTHTVTQQAEQDKPLWVITENADGTRSRVFTTDGGDPLYKEEIDAQGNRTEVFGDNKLKIESKADGTYNVTTEQAYTYTTKNAYTVKADGAITIESTQTELVTIKNSVASLKDILDELIDDIAGMSTVGSPASHTVNPADIAKLNLLKSTKVDMVLG